jgi:hypothetical protein
VYVVPPLEQAVQLAKLPDENEPAGQALHVSLEVLLYVKP